VIDTPSRTPLRVGVIGLGVGEQQAEAVAANPSCALVAICDFDAEKLARVAARFPQARAVAADSEVLDDPEIDVVCIASHDHHHFTQTLRALENGKHVFVEKPFVLQEREARTIREQLRTRPGLRLSSNLVLRTSPRFVDLRRRIDAGELGRLFYLDGDYNYGRMHKITSGWRGELEFYSAVHGGGVHIVDLMMWLAHDRIVEVSAVGNAIASAGSGFRNFDMVAAVVRFAGGAVGKLAVNFGCVYPHFHRFNVYGTAATFENERGPARFYTTRDPTVAPAGLDTVYPGTHKGALIASFVDAILGRGRATVEEEDVFASMAVCFAIEKSVHGAGIVRVDYN
jgi:predicted dehydrogenase